MSRDALPASVVETLESRRLMAAIIAGVVVQDLTGNGISADDRGLGGVVVKLYKDKNANGLVDAADGAALGTKTSAAGTGLFAFTGVARGKYLVQETVGANQVRTGPFLTDTIAVDVTKKKGLYGGNVFANYVKDFDRSAVSGITYSINGGAPVASIDGVKQGDTVKVNFTVAAGKTVTVTLVSYKAPEPISTAENLQFQELYQADTGTFTGGTHSLTVQVPDCYFQLDFVGGLPIDPFGPAGSDILYARQGRRIAFVNGGNEACGCDDPPPCERPPSCEPPAVCKPPEPPVCEPKLECEPPKPDCEPPKPPVCEEPKAPPCEDDRDRCDDDDDRDGDDKDKRDRCDDDDDRRDGKKSRKDRKDRGDSDDCDDDRDGKRKKSKRNGKR